jgi:hypothetical protein
MTSTSPATVIAVEDCAEDRYVIYFSDGTFTVVTSPELTAAFKDRSRVELAEEDLFSE